MNARRSVILGAVLATLVCYFALFEGFSVERPPPESEAGVKLFDCKVSGPTEIQVTSRRGTVVARKVGDDWQTSAGGFAPAAFAGLAEALCRLPAIDRIAGAAKLEDFGLEPSAAEIRVTIGGRERRLLVGAATPASNLLYAKFAGEPDVLKVGAELAADVERVTAFATAEGESS
jgi:hypothetical protein